MTSMTGPNGIKGNQVPRGYGTYQLQNMTPEQMQLMQDRISDLSGNNPMSQIAKGDPSAFQQLEAPAWQDFGRAMTGIGNRFSNQGMGGRHGSGFQKDSSQAAQSFSQMLQAQRMGLMRNAQQDIFNMSNQLLQQNPYSQGIYQKAPKKPSFLQNLMGAAAPVVGAIAGGTMAGPQGAAMGAHAGSTFSSAFTGQESPQADWSSFSQLPTSWGGGPGGGYNSNLRMQAEGIYG